MKTEKNLKANTGALEITPELIDYLYKNDLVLSMSTDADMSMADEKKPKAKITANISVYKKQNGSK